jgi:PAS domain S-box-containing protein
VSLTVLVFYFSLKENYVLFHTIVELFAIVIAFAVFIVTWNARKMMDNMYLYFVGISYIFVGALDLLHTLTFKGMNVIGGDLFYANQFWIVTRFIAAATLLIGFLFLRGTKKLNADLIFIAYFAISLVATMSILVWHRFPVCFIEGVGQTPFKIYAEYVIIFMLIIVGVLLYRHRSRFSIYVYRLLTYSLVFMILSEFCFTLYVSNYSFANAVGHCFKLVAFFLIYKANVETGFLKPTAVIFKELKDNAEEYRTLAENLPGLILRFDHHQHCIFANSAAEKFMGGDKDLNKLPRELYLAIKAGLAAVATDLLSHHQSEVLLSEEAHENYYHVQVVKEVNLEDAKGTFLVICQDITIQRLAIKELDESNHRLKIAMDAGSLGATEVVLKTGEMTCSEQFKKNYGRRADEDFNYADLFEAILPQYRANVRGLVQLAIKEKSIYQAVYQVKWPDGTLHWISAHGRARYNDKGEADRIVGVTLDVTERKLFEQRKDDFLSIASHELKTPMTSLKASLQLLNNIKEKPTSSIHVKLIDQANRSMDKMADLIDHLLNINRLTEGQLKLTFNEFVLWDMLSVTCGHVRIEGKHELILQGDRSLLVYADENRIEQVVVNFVNNAVKYAPLSKEIYLSVEQIGNRAKVSVRDTGAGIEKEELKFVFDRYYRVNHHGNAYSGLGLGLYICAEIIKRHGGEIGVESGLGEGSTFWFTLPIGIAHEEAPVAFETI